MKYSIFINALFILSTGMLISAQCFSSEVNSLIVDKENDSNHTLSNITLEEVLRIAADTHPSIAQRLSEQGASDYGVAGAQWQQWPGVSMSSSRGPLGNTLTELQLEQPLWTGGRITANMNAAEARAEAARHSVLEARKMIIERAINIYAEVIRLQSRIAIANRAIEDFEGLTAMIDRRVENGISPKADAVNIRARLQQANSERLQLHLQRRNSLSELELLIGKRCSELALPATLLPATINVEEAVQASLQYAPELARLNAEERVAEETVAAARSNLSPSVSLRYQRIFGGGALYATDQLFLGVTYQPGNGLSSLSAIREAEVRRTGTSYAREVARLDLINRVRNLWQQADSSRREQSVLVDLVASTQEVYASFLRQFPVGRRTWLEVLLARRDATQAQYALSDTQWTGFAAELKLQLITGQLAARHYRISVEGIQ